MPAPQALGDSPFVGNYDHQTKVGASRSSAGGYAGDSKSFYLDSANTPEVVLFDDAASIAALAFTPSSAIKCCEDLLRMLVIVTVEMILAFRLDNLDSV